MTAKNDATPEVRQHFEGQNKITTRQESITEPAFQSRKKRNLLGDLAELQRLIISAAAQCPGKATNTTLARIQDGAMSDKTYLDVIAVAGRNPGSGNAVIPMILEDFGYDGDPWALDEYVTELNSLYQKFKRETPIVKGCPKEFAATHCTDIANGLRFANQFTGVALHSTPMDWLVWDGMRWKRDPKEARELAKKLPMAIRAEAKHILDDAPIQDREVAELFDEYADALKKWAKMTASTKGISNAMVEAATTPGINADHLEFDTDPFLLTCINGTVDLRTGDLAWHDSKHRITKLVPHEYKPGAKCPRWLQFLDEVFEGDQAVVDYIQWALGYSLTGSVKHHLLFVMHGGGRNGKGALIRAVQHVMGAEHATTLNPEELLAQKHARHATAIAAIRGTRFVSSQETDKNRRLNESLVKTLSGGDRLKARFMARDEFEFDPTFKIWLATNHLPKIDGEGAAGNLWDRIRLIPFMRRFEGAAKDPDLDEKLKAEAEGILAWMVQGAIAAATGPEPKVPDPCRVALESYQKESDLLGEFLEENTTRITGSNCLKSRLHDAFTRWSRTPIDFRTFNKQVANRGFETKHTELGAAWRDLFLMPQEQLAEVG